MSTKLALSFPAAKAKKKKETERKIIISFSKPAKEYSLSFQKETDTLYPVTKFISNSASE